MISEMNIEEALSRPSPVIDVRTPAEFEQGHIPGTVNIPLFSNEERAHVGTIYKQQSKEEAIALGYEYVTPKLKSFISESFSAAPNGDVIVHCWRGGMRSHSFAEHLSKNGFHHVRVITGGYKAYRNHLLNSLGLPYQLKILGGYTGSGKTYILHELKKRGAQVIDLEGLAHHRGSAFGGIDQGIQPTSEQFENNLFDELRKFDREKPIWVEDESHNIGGVNIPQPFLSQMQNTKVFFIDIPKTERARHLVQEYAGCDKQMLIASIQRISKRLGGLNVKNAIESLMEEKYYDVALIALGYYDKSYIRAMGSRKCQEIISIPLSSINHHENALILEKY